MGRIAVLILSILILSTSASQARSLHDPNERPESERLPFSKATVTHPPNQQICVHKANNMFFSVTNFGCFGSMIGYYYDCETNRAAESCEFPAGTDQNYLWIGGLWIGAVSGVDTLVSVAHDGWHSNFEMWPCAEDDCGLVKTSNRPSDPNYDEDAKSDLDFKAVYTDTLDDPQWTGRDWNDIDHQPLNLKITQKSYSWSANYAGDFVLIDYDIENIGDADLEDVYLGIYVDAEAGHLSRYAFCHLDDFCGFRETYPSRAGHGYLDTIDLAYIADDDGDPGVGDEYDYASVQSATGVRVMRTPGDDLRVSFNWWISNPNSQFDWGPMKESVRRNYGTGGQGTPEGDASKYYLMSNGEHDYDQMFAGRSFADEGWLPPNSAISEIIARGGDTRFVLSMGPFDLPVGKSQPFTIAYVAGEEFHRDHRNFNTYMINQYNPEEFYSTLDFSDVAENAVWASWVYDNPGVDTDGDGYAGPFWEIEDTLATGEVVLDSFYYAGDGVPDFKAAAAPPPPVLRVSTSQETVRLRWNGLITETSIDPFTRVRDFEGYRVYMGRLNTIDKLALVFSHDLEDYHRLLWDDDSREWLRTENPLSLGILRQIYGEGFDPLDYPVDPNGSGLIVDSKTYCFDPVEWNRSIPGWDDGSSAIEDVGFAKRFIDDINSGMVTSENDIEDTLTSYNWFKDVDPLTGDSAYFHKYYEYECVLDNLLPSVPWYFSVTAFDFGDATFQIDPLETSPLANAIEAWPINEAAVVLDEQLQVTVYPNPYYGDGRYVAAGYEDQRKSGFVDHERRMHFLNLPTTCKVRIYTLDGDLVRALTHPGVYTQTDSKLAWDLRSTNNELVTSGIYIFVVEADQGNQIGKLVIIL